MGIFTTGRFEPYIGLVHLVKRRLYGKLRVCILNKFHAFYLLKITLIIDLISIIVSLQPDTININKLEGLNR